ncbi:MAG: hydrogenase formation protein HypD [Actinomycetota bacterium]
MVKYISEYRDKSLSEQLIRQIKDTSTKKVNFMEVCGTHTVAISKNGLREAMPDTISLLSGPGCPVCVTANRDIDRMIAILQEPDVTLTTFGDMIKVPGSYSSLTKERAEGRDVRVVYSTIDAIKIAEQNPDKRVVFFAVGFETTVPAIGLSVLEAKKKNLKNYSILTVHKVIPPAMKALLDLGEVRLDGFICPGHVSTIIGSKPYEFITRDYGIPCVISGFEPVDVLETILMLIRQSEKGEARVEVQYKRAVRPEGNPVALEVVDRVFEPTEADWRGIGVIPGSGLKLKGELADFDAELIFSSVEVPPTKEPRGCRCGEVLRGVVFPYQCGLFGRICTPEDPVGPCMVSSEGACAAYYRYDTMGVKK